MIPGTSSWRGCLVLGPRKCYPKVEASEAKCLHGPLQFSLSPFFFAHHRNWNSSSPRLVIDPEPLSHRANIKPKNVVFTLPLFVLQLAIRKFSHLFCLWGDKKKPSLFRRGYAPHLEGILRREANKLNRQALMYFPSVIPGRSFSFCPISFVHNCACFILGIKMPGFTCCWALHSEDSHVT